MSNFYGITDVWAFVLASVLIVLAPGPNSLFVFSLALQKNHTQATKAAFGIFTGDMILMIIAATSAATLTQLFPGVLRFIKILGAIYLAWIGFQLFRYGLKNFNSKIKSEFHKIKISSGSPYLKALVISLFNPKAIIFLSSFFIQFIDTSYEYRYLPYLIEIAIVMFCSACYLFTLIRLGSLITQKLDGKNRIQGSLQMAIGFLFFLFGLLLGLSQR